MDREITIKIDLAFLFLGLVDLHINQERRRKEMKMVKGLRFDCAQPARRMAHWSLPLASVKSARTSYVRIARMRTVKQESQSRTPWKRWRPPSSTTLEGTLLKVER